MLKSSDDTAQKFGVGVVIHELAVVTGRVGENDEETQRMRE
jgi:hypothetical protein